MSVQTSLEHGIYDKQEAATRQPRMHWQTFGHFIGLTAQVLTPLTAAAFHLSVPVAGP